MTEEFVLENFNLLSADKHELLKVKTREEIYDNGKFMAPGGLLLINYMVKAINIVEGSYTLDLGCGRGQSSVFLAKKYKAKVVSVDAWIDTETRNHLAKEHG